MSLCALRRFGFAVRRWPARTEAPLARAVRATPLWIRGTRKMDSEMSRVAPEPGSARTGAAGTTFERATGRATPMGWGVFAAC